MGAVVLAPGEDGKGRGGPQSKGGSGLEGRVTRGKRPGGHIGQPM